MGIGIRDFSGRPEEILEILNNHETKINIDSMVRFY